MLRSPPRHHDLDRRIPSRVTGSSAPSNPLPRPRARSRELAAREPRGIYLARLLRREAPTLFREIKVGARRTASRIRHTAVTADPRGRSTRGRCPFARSRTCCASARPGLPQSPHRRNDISIIGVIRKAFLSRHTMGRGPMDPRRWARRFGCAADIGCDANGEAAGGARLHLFARVSAGHPHPARATSPRAAKRSAAVALASLQGARALQAHGRPTAHRPGPFSVIDVGRVGVRYSWCP